MQKKEKESCTYATWAFVNQKVNLQIPRRLNHLSEVIQLCKCSGLQMEIKGKSTKWNKASIFKFWR